MRGGLLLMMLAVTIAGTFPALVRAQTEVTLELGASQVGPPSGVEGDDARFAMGGLRLSHYTLGGSGVSASMMFGRAFGDTTGGDFTSALVVGTLRDRWGSRWTAGMDVDLVGFEVRAPFPYRAIAVDGGPSLGLDVGPVSLTATGVLGVGRSTSEIWRRFLGVHRVFEDHLWRVGGTGEILVGNGTMRAGLAGGLHDTPAGTYSSGGARLLFSNGWGAAEARADVWETPLGTEVTGGLTFVISLSGWSVRGFGGKSEPDPLTLAEPGSGSGSLTVGVPLYESEVRLGIVDAPYEILDEDEEGARVRLEVDAPANARAVSLLGDFTLWQPLPMSLDGGRWTTVVDVPVGTYHYGFMIDDEWYVPEDTAGVVPDEWGRLNAILVIEGVS